MSLQVRQGQGNITIGFLIPDGFRLVNALVSSPSAGLNVSTLTVDTATSVLNFDANVSKVADAGTASYCEAPPRSTCSCQTWPMDEHPYRMQAR